MSSEPYEYCECPAYPLDKMQELGKFGWRFAYTIEVERETATPVFKYGQDCVHIDRTRETIAVMMRGSRKAP